MKKLITFAVDYPITILMGVFAVLLLGTISFQRLGMDLFPEMENPRIFIDLKSGERPPEEIEKQYVTGIESQAIRQKNAIQISSVSQVGAAQLTVEYAWGTNMDEAYLSLQRALSRYKQNEDIDELNITQHDPNSTPIILLGLSHPDITDMNELRKVAESYLRDELIRLEGIADVRMIGQEYKEVVIETNQYLLDAFGLTTSSLANRITQYNRNVAGGSITEMGTRYIIQGISEFNALKDIEQVIVAYTQPASQTLLTNQNNDRVPVYLKDVAEIKFLNKEPENIVRINQTRSMALAVYKETKYNTVKAVEEFLVTLESIKNRLPGYNLQVIQNKGEFITNAIDEVKQTLVLGIFLAVIILFVFLRRIGTTVIISLAIPISIVATFNLMYFNGLTLNIMTLGGLALGAGMLVDNSIIVMENIYRNIEEGKSLKDAIILGTSQVSGAITASTVTTIVVFLPIVYLRGSEGELFQDQAWTVAFSLLSSLAVALLVIPMLSKKLLKERQDDSRKSSSVHFPLYAGVLR
ncbi:efflux RND transporter permease subunit, partial [candidate division KSB1 bacterium]|nr:efflux RND transporter permease subunit [candidate division KSB1 bacterium]